MLDYIRNKSSNKFVSLALIIMAIAMGFWGVQSFFGSSSFNNKIAKVGNTEISVKDFSNFIHKNQLMLNNSFSQLENNDQIKLNWKKKLLNDLVYHYGLLDSFNENSYFITNDQVQKQLITTPLFLENNKFSYDRYIFVLSKLGLSENQLINEVKLTLILKNLQRTFDFSSLVMLKEINEFNDYMSKSYNFKRIEIIDKKSLHTLISQDQIKQFYDENKDEFMEPEYWNLNYIFIPYDYFKSTIKITNNEIKNYYKKHINNFKFTKQYKLESFILTKVANNSKASSNENIINKMKSFNMPQNKLNKIKNEINNDYWSVIVDKSQAWQNVSNYTFKIDSTNKLAKGQYSKIIKTKNKIIIHKIVDIKPEKTKNLNEVALFIKNKIINEKFLNSYTNLSDQIAEQAYLNSSSLNKLSTTFNVAIKKLNFNFSSLGKNKIFNEDVVKNYIKANKLLLNQNSDIIETKNGWLVINPTKYSPSQPKKLHSIKNQIIKRIKSRITHNKSFNLANKYVEMLNKNKNIDKLLAKNDLKWSQTNNIKLIDGSYKIDFLKNVYSLLPGESKVYIDESNKIWIIKCENITDMKINELNFNHHIDELRKQLSNLELILLHRGLISKTKVKIFVNDNQLSAIN